MKKALALLLAALMLFGLVACGGNNANSGSDNKADSSDAGNAGGDVVSNDDKVLTISLATELQTLSIMGQSNIVTNEVLTNIYSGLLQFDQDGNVSPCVAESWEWNEDELKYTFKIRDDIKFHDGSDLTAEDVAFSIQLMLDEYPSFQSTLASMIKEVKQVDEYTVDVYMNSVAAAFLYNCCINCKIYSKAAWEPTNHYTEGIVATGPYKLVSYDPTIGVELEAFEDYFGDIKPAIKHVKFVITPDANTQVLALQNQELNISRDFPASAISTIEADENLDVFSHKCGMTYYLQFNLRDNAHEALKDVRVRQAINYCLDKEFILAVAEEGIGTVANTVGNPNMFGYDDNIPYYEYNVEKALELMKEAGYENGFEMEPMICRAGKDEKVAEIAIENLAAIGIKTSVTVVETNTFIEQMSKGNFTLSATHINLNTDGGAVFDIASIRGPIPFSGFEDPVIENYRDLSVAELDTETRRTQLNENLVYMSEQALFAPCYHAMKSYAHTKDVVFNGYDPFVGLQLCMLDWA